MTDETKPLLDEPFFCLPTVLVLSVIFCIFAGIAFQCDKYWVGASFSVSMGLTLVVAAFKYAMGKK